MARGAEEEKHLEELLQRGKTNGVQNLRIVKREELMEMEVRRAGARRAGARTLTSE